MFGSNIITFTAQEDYCSLKEDYPTPALLNVPDWFKKLTNVHPEVTAKGCMPFLDAMTAGYILKIPIDIKIVHNVLNKETNKPDSFFSVPEIPNVGDFKININTNNYSHHPIKQLAGSPLIEKNKGLSFFKILNPWTITTPPGYSCLFVNLLNNYDDRFEIISGIVDTDVYKQEINFPVVFNGDKYPTLDTVLKKGTPYVQVIPFKREKWKMKIEPRTSKSIYRNYIQHKLEMVDRYRKRLWHKKLWK